MSTSQEVLKYTAQCRAVVPRGLPKTIIGLADNPAVQGVESKVVSGVGYVEGAPSYTITEQIGVHEHGHLDDMNNKDRRSSFWAWRFAGCPTAPKYWEEAETDAQGRWHMLPVETIAEGFVRGVTNGKYLERTLTYGCDADPYDMRIFFGGGPLDVIVLPSPNHSSRLGQNIKYKVIHTTEGYDSRSWLTNPVSQVSANYLVRPEGIYALVPERLAAWHAGIIVGTPTTPLYTPGINPNTESIGIEIEGFAGNPLSATMMGLVVSLIKDIDSRYGVTPNIGHYHLSPGNRSDPGVGNLAMINAAVAAETEGEDDMFTDQDRADLQRIRAQLDAEGSRIWTQRLQDWLSKIFKSLFSGNIDYTGPDVTSGKPRT